MRLPERLLEILVSRSEDDTTSDRRLIRGTGTKRTIDMHCLP
jgi:hypothetical protein